MRRDAAFFQGFSFLRKRGNGESKSCVVSEQTPTFPKEMLCKPALPFEGFHWKRGRASLWDLYLAFAILLMKYFINNVNILDRESTVASHSICTAIATRRSAFICLEPMILKLFIAHVSLFNQGVFGIPCSGDLDKRINSASTS